MANWCDTIYRIYAEKENLDLLHDALKSMAADAKDDVAVGSVSTLLSDIGYDPKLLLNAGCDLSSYVTKFEEHYSENDKESFLQIDCFEAWCPKANAWNIVFEHYLGDTYNVRYYAIEPNEDLCITNDSCLDEMYYIDGEDIPRFGNSSGIQAATKDETIRLLQWVTNSQNTDIQKMTDEINEESWIYISEWAVIEFDELLRDFDAESCKSEGVCL